MMYIGTSGWSYPAFEEKLYHKKLKSLEQLTLYAATFNTVEINYSFYHIPKPQSFKNWFEATPENFAFTIKLNRDFTHEQKLLLDLASQTKLKIFLQNTTELKHKFKVLLIQTPPSLEFDIARLQAFMQLVSTITKDFPHPPRLAFEFRNETWFQEPVYAELKKYGAGIVISQSSVYPEKHVVVSNLIYIRLHGPKKMFSSAYTQAELKKWQEFLLHHPESESYVYFNNTIGGKAIDNALSLQRLLLN